MGSVLDREGILATRVSIETIDVERLGGAVCLREMSAADRDQLEQWIATESSKKKALHNVRARVAWYVLCDEEGNRIFKDVKDIEELGQLPAEALDQVFEKAKSMNGLFEADGEVAKN